MVMDQIAVDGAFMVTIGRGAGPEVVAFIRATDPDGSPVVFDHQDPGLEIVTGLSAMFGTASFPCEITDVETIFPPPPGFIGVTVDLRNPGELGGNLAHIGPAALGVTLTRSSGRGVGVLVSAGAAHPQTWWAERQPPVVQRS